MQIPALFRRRSVPLPTFAGSLLLAALLGGIATAVVRSLPSYLAPNEPLGHGILVVEGWIPEGTMLLAAETFRRGAYDALVVTGGPLEDPLCRGDFPTYADHAAAQMRRLGLSEPQLVVVPAPASAHDRTYRSAVSVRQWIESSGRPVTAIDLFSLGSHGRRSWALFRLALGDAVEVGVRSAPSQCEVPGWWHRSACVRTVLTEAIGYAWTLCCFHPGPRGSHEEIWGVPRLREP